MSPPEFDSQGNLPVGVHRASLDEVIARFGHGTSQRQLVTTRLIRVYELASNTSKLKRFIIFGSYVTAKADPNDVDIILIMHDDFTQQECAVEARPLFDHLRAQQEFSASVFAIRPSQILLETVDSFVTHWQIRRRQGPARDRGGNLRRVR
jgi:predicted nucleotidyltransferase